MTYTPYDPEAVRRVADTERQRRADWAARYPRYDALEDRFRVSRSQVAEALGAPNNQRALVARVVEQSDFAQGQALGIPAGTYRVEHDGRDWWARRLGS